MLPTTANGHVTFSEKTDRADLHRYVELRESYDWETISDMHAAVMFMSDDHEKEAYDALVRGPAAPLKLLKDQARVIATVGSITFVGIDRTGVLLAAAASAERGRKAPGADVLDCDGRFRARGRSGKAGPAGCRSRTAFADELRGHARLDRVRRPR